MTFRTTELEGPYFRVASPRWEDPLDGEYPRQRGGRWNPPGSFPVVYLFSAVPLARALVETRFEGHPFDVFDLRPEAHPTLVTAQVPRDDFANLVSNDGLTGAGLPTTYPRDAHGRTVGWSACQPIGTAAWGEGSSGIASRSATATPTATASTGAGSGVEGHELAWFQRGTRLAVGDVRFFPEWFPK